MSETLTDSYTDPEDVAAVGPVDHLAELEERVRAGDTTISPAMLAKARDAALFGELVVESDRRVAAAEAERARLARIDEIAADWRPSGAHAEVAADVVAALDVAVEALRRVFEGVDALQAATRATWAELQALGPVPDAAGIVARGGGISPGLIRPDGVAVNVFDHHGARLAGYVLREAAGWQRLAGLTASTLIGQGADVYVEALTAIAGESTEVI